MADKMSIDRIDLVKEDSEESSGSSPEPDAPASATTTTPQDNQQPKRKGGRKPIYATSEERKQRNRQAQAAFRERRTEYIKQLEETIRVHEQNLHNLQNAHRHAADECLMLRYKNSLLERILLEKGIDVQAELRAKTGSPNLGPTHMPQNLVQPPPIRALLGRHGRRSNSSIAPKVEPGISSSPLPPPLHPHSSTASPKNRPTPPSNSASPAATTSFGSHHGASPATSDHLSAQIRHSVPLAGALKQNSALVTGQMPAINPASVPRQVPLSATQSSQPHSAVVASVDTSKSFYPTPSFQNHIEQLEQEYDAAADMLDDTAEAPDTPSGPGPYPGGTVPHPLSLSSQAGAHHHSATDGLMSQSTAHNGAYPTMTQLLDPTLDWDPFGLSASMAFPSQFSFDTSNMR